MCFQLDEKVLETPTSGSGESDLPPIHLNRAGSYSWVHCLPHTKLEEVKRPDKDAGALIATVQSDHEWTIYFGAPHGKCASTAISSPSSICVNFFHCVFVN